LHSQQSSRGWEIGDIVHCAKQRLTVFHPVGFIGIVGFWWKLWGDNALLPGNFADSVVLDRVLLSVNARRDPERAVRVILGLDLREFGVVTSPE
jgi:hypothetical protein